MKSKFPAVLALLCTSNILLSQVIFSENFQGGLPGTWTLIDNDGLTPHADVAVFTSAWIVGENSNQSGDSVMMSTSWYSPVGTADDWLITPAINLTNNNDLEWDAKAQDPSFPDGYEVRISTTTPTIAGFLANPALFTIAAENATWTYRNIDLQAAGYANQQVYLAWRNNSTDQFILMIDSIKVSGIPSFDASLCELVPQLEYTQIPISQSMNILQSGIIKNAGIQPITGVKLEVMVWDSDMMTVHNGMSATLPLAPGASDTFDLPGYIPTTADTFSLSYYSTINEADADPNNDTMTQSIILSDSVYAREDGISTGGLGIGAGVSGELGQLFVLKEPDTLTSVSAFIANLSGQMTDQPLSANIYSVVGGYPSVLLGSTDTITVDASQNQFWTLSVPGGLPLPMDSFAIAVVEPDSNVSLGYSTNYFKPKTTYIDWPDNPFGTWTPAEDFGFMIAFLLRANFGLGPAYDAELVEVEFPSDYHQIPLNQIRGCPLNIGCTVKNAGSETITNVTACCNIYRGTNLVATLNSNTIPQLLSKTGQMLLFDNSYKPIAQGTYTLEYVVKIDENDATTSNDTSYARFTITNELFARDTGLVTSHLSIGKGSAGILGQNFTLKTADSLYAAYFLSTGPMVGDTTSLVVYDVDEATGQPMSMIAESPIYIFSEADSLVPNLIKLSFDQPLHLPAGTFYLGMRESVSGRLSLGTTMDIFTPSTCWVFLNSAWKTNESFGLPLSYLLRPEFGMCKDSLFLATTVLGSEMQETYQASWNITSTDTIKSGAMGIYYDSGGSVDLLPGFIIENGVTWMTMSDGCTQSLLLSHIDAPVQSQNGITSYSLLEINNTDDTPSTPDLRSRLPWQISRNQPPASILESLRTVPPSGVKSRVNAKKLITPRVVRKMDP